MIGQGAKRDSETIKLTPPTSSDSELELLYQIAANTYVIASVVQKLKLPLWLLPRRSSDV